MINKKALALAIASMGAVSAANAAMYSKAPAPKACTGVNVTVPCDSQAFDVGVQALYVQPLSGSNQYWAPVYNSNFNDFRMLDSDPKWAWGFRLEGSYHFGNGNDLNVNWTHFSKKTEQFNVYRLPFFPANSTARLDFYNDNKFDSVNIEMGQHVDFGEHKNIRFHGGVQVARIDYTNNWNVNSINFPGAPANAAAWRFNVNDFSRFDGFGPRAGMDMSYDFGNGFSMLVNTAGTVLVGTLKSNTVFTATGTGNPVPLPFAGGTDLSASKTSIVPGVEAKFGATYTHSMAQGDLTLQGGWMFANYWDAVQSALLRPGQHNFGYQGPYLGLKWVGNA